MKIARWAHKYGLVMNFIDPNVFAERTERWKQLAWDQEELPARAYYAAVGTGKEAVLDLALFRAAWVEGLDVNEESVVRRAIVVAGLDPENLMRRAFSVAVKEQLSAALNAFERDQCPGVPTWVVNGERFWGKDRIEWLAERVEAILKLQSF